MTGELHLGTAGWSYKDWVGPFYPRGTQARDYLAYFATRFSTVEIDSTFYAIPEEKVVVGWRENAPEQFFFSPKFPQIITHHKRLEDCSLELELFLERMALLQSKLGPMVLQFDFNFTPDDFKQLERFLPQLPTSNRYAVEIRNRKWLGFNAFFELLEAHRCAVVIQDLYYMPRYFRLTAPFAYIRLLGDRRKVPSDFSHARIDRENALSQWAERIVQMMSEGVEVFAYSNNRYQGHAPHTAATLKKKIEYLQLTKP